jgi:hypothetical protein
MVKFETDEAVQALGSVDSIDGLASLLSLLSGERIDAEELSSDAKDAVAEILKRVRDSGPDNLHMTYEEFNELLLIFNQNGKLGQTPKLKMKRNCVEFRSAKDNPRSAVSSLRAYEGPAQGLRIALVQYQPGGGE